MTSRLYTIKSIKEHVPSTVDSVVRFIEKESGIYHCECIRDIKVVLSELLVNAIIHGNNEKAEKPVDVRVDILSDKIRIKVTDRGVSFKPEKCHKDDILCENGRGISICHILCRKLEYSFEKGKGNSATAVFILKNREDDIMTKLRELYYCKQCGNLVEMTAEGAGELVCCGEPMELLEAKTADQGKEKHVPVVSDKDGGVLVKVGDVPHPMTEEHWITFIEVCTSDTVIRKELKSGDTPEAWFNVKPSEVVCVRSYCNLHGLWTAK